MQWSNCHLLCLSRCRFACFQVLGAVSPSISESLTFDNLRGADRIIALKCRAGVVAEVKFATIAIQVRRADVVISAGDAALQDREINPDRIGMNIATNLLINAVVDDLVAAEFLAHVMVLTGIVGHQCGTDWVPGQIDPRFRGDDNEVSARAMAQRGPSIDVSPLHRPRLDTPALQQKLTSIPSLVALSFSSLYCHT